MPLEFLDELSDLIRQIIHRPLETGQEVERHHNREPNGRNSRENSLLHGSIYLLGISKQDATERLVERMQSLPEKSQRIVLALIEDMLEKK